MWPLIAVGALAALAIGMAKSGSLSGILPASVSNAIGSTLPPSLGGYSTIGPNSDPSTWYNNIKPGTIYYNGQAQPPLAQSGGPNATSLGTMAASQTVSALGATGAGSAGGLFGGGAMAAGTTAAKALPLIGTAIGVVSTVLGLIAAHHKAALAKEGQVLNQADPRLYTTFGLIIQGIMNGEITSVGQATAIAKQAVTDYQTAVASVKRGSWAFSGTDMSADYQTVWIKRTQKPGSDYHAPDPCNAACVIDHFFAQRGAFLVTAAATDIFAGKHGVMVLPAIPPHATQSGMQEVDVYY